VVQALIFTVLVRAMNIGVRKLWWILWHRNHPYGEWTDEKELVWSLFCAVLLGLIVAMLANWDYLHRVLRWLKVTKRTSYPSEWYSAFHRFKRDVVLHLKGERRLMGWAEEWPDQPDKGHFIIEDTQWLAPDGTAFPQSEVLRTMVPASDVEMVQFLYKPGKAGSSVDKIEEERKNLAELQAKDVADPDRDTKKEE
jgi:Family of unknown function (DUF6338)